MAKKLRIAGASPVLIVVAVVMALIAAVAIWLNVSTSPLDSGNTDSVKVEIRSGASVEEAAATLKSKGVIRDQLSFSIYARLTFAKIQAGTHLVSPSMSARDILDIMGSTSDTTYMVTILPEKTVSDIKGDLVHYGFTEAEIDAAFAKNYEHPLLADKPADVGLEGYIFPDTYEMHSNDTVETLIVKTFDNLYEKLRASGSLSLMATRGLSIYETLTFASIVAKEVPTAEDQKMIAGIFWTRLENNISLGADATFRYAYNMGYCAVNGPSCDSIYNTRIHRGLPPGPISNMKYSTIQAVLEPTESNYLYFISGDNGQTHFAATEAEHQANIRNYCQVLCR